ncbi:MAG: protein kinase domain-containing protein [bacterium]
MNYGRYQIVKEIGKGSMGVVYEAYDPDIDRRIALKVLREDRVTSKAFVERFLKEAKAIGRFSHSNVVTVYDVGQDQGTIFIAMELVEGKPLDKVIQGKKLDINEIVDLAIQVAEILECANQMGIVHRDIKPSNIILMPNARIKITDFGIAHIEDPSGHQLTQAGEILGTPAYMAPEQVIGCPVDGRSDLFSLGCILYEITTGSRPFQGNNLAAIFNSITKENPVEPSKKNPEIPKDLSHIIMKCLEKSPKERFQTGGAMVDALNRFKTTLNNKYKKEEIFPKHNKLKKTFLFVIMTVIIVGMTAGIIKLASFYFLTKEPTSQEEIVPPAPGVRSLRIATLNIESIPTGAQVIIDGVLKGKTPLKLDLPLGKHEVRLTLPNYEDSKVPVYLEQEGKMPLLIRMIQADGKLP